MLMNVLLYWLAVCEHSILYIAPLCTHRIYSHAIQTSSLTPREMYGYRQYQYHYQYHYMNDTDRVCSATSYKGTLSC